MGLAGQHGPDQFGGSSVRVGARTHRPPANEEQEP